jgi:hypothetical protein
MTDQAVVLRLEKQADRTDEFVRFEKSLRELVQVLVDLLERVENQQVPDFAAPLAAALMPIAHAMQAVKIAAPQVSVPVEVNPTTIAPAGTQWRVSYTRTPKGGELMVTKL